MADGGSFEHPWNRLQATPPGCGKSALCKVLRVPSEDMESPNVPKQLCKLTININKELFLSWLDDIAKFDMMMVRMG